MTIINDDMHPNDIEMILGLEMKHLRQEISLKAKPVWMPRDPTHRDLKQK